MIRREDQKGDTVTFNHTMSGFGFSTGATGYDDEDRLKTWNRTNGTMNQAWTLSAVGNWDAFTSAGSTWNRTHSNAHEFTGFTGASTGTLAYDVKGNQTSRPSTLSAPALNLDWNFDNQLRGADTNGSAGSLEVTFEYDALGRRVSRSHSSGNVVYVHAGQQVIADYARGAVTSSPTYRYVYADYVDEPILRHSGTGTSLPGSGDDALFYHRNQQYSVIGLTNAAGTLVERYSYTAYGTLGIYDPSGTVRTTSTYANRYTYTGREYDADLNLYHFRARWYDPTTGGFISRDPLGYVDGMSLYRGYFGLKSIDPTGLMLVSDGGRDDSFPVLWHKYLPVDIMLWWDYERNGGGNPFPGSIPGPIKLPITVPDDEYPNEPQDPDCECKNIPGANVRPKAPSTGRYPPVAGQTFAECIADKSMEERTTTKYVGECMIPGRVMPLFCTKCAASKCWIYTRWQCKKRRLTPTSPYPHIKTEWSAISSAASRCKFGE